MEIVYCENCGTRIPEPDINAGKAVKSGADYFCAECVEKLGIRPDPPKPQVRRKTPRPMRARGPTRTPARGVQSAASPRARSSRRAQGPAKAVRQPPPAAKGGQGTIVFALGAGIVAFMLTLGVILILGAKKKQEKKERRPRRTRVPVSVPKKKVEPPAPTSLFAPRGAPAGTRLAAPPPPPPPPPAETFLPDLEETKRAGEVWLANRTGPCPKPFLEVPRASGPPVIDGELADACWEIAARSSTFTTGPENAPAAEQVTMLVCYDASALYVAFDCKDPDINNVLRAATETGKAVWDDDSVELFFDADRDYGTYVQFLANVDGVSQTYENLGAKPQETPIEGFEVKTKLYADRWTVECSLSYAALRGTAPKAGTVWGAQFVKNGREPGAEKSYSACWAKLWGGSTHRPALFAFLAFK